jgi:hypothetical protein
VKNGIIYKPNARRKTKIKNIPEFGGYSAMVEM